MYIAGDSQSRKWSPRTGPAAVLQDQVIYIISATLGQYPNETQLLRNHTYTDARIDT